MFPDEVANVGVAGSCPYNFHSRVRITRQSSDLLVEALAGDAELPGKVSRQGRLSGSIGSIHRDEKAPPGSEGGPDLASEFAMLAGVRVARALQGDRAKSH